MPYIFEFAFLGGLIGVCWLVWKKHGWSILQSRSSTAAIGFLLLPFYGLIAALGGLLLAVGRKKHSRMQASIGGLLVLAVLSFHIASGLSTRSKNQQREAAHQAQLERQRLVTDELRALFASNPGREAEALDEYVKTKDEDRAVALSVLRTKHVSPQLLNHFAQSEDLGVLLSVIRNDNVTPDLMEEIYEKASYKDYFHTDLSRNPKTSATILKQIASSSMVRGHKALIKHPNTDCEVLKAVEADLTSKDRDVSQKAQLLSLASNRKQALCR